MGGFAYELITFWNWAKLHQCQSKVKRLNEFFFDNHTKQISKVDLQELENGHMCIVNLLTFLIFI